ncbi:hypothetical protein Tco_1229511 [Tanacetum coccineum]
MNVFSVVKRKAPTGFVNIQGEEIGVSLSLSYQERRLEDVNQKLLRSLSPEWNTYAVVWRNKADLDTMSMDDLYNNLKVTNGVVNTAQAVNTAHGVSTASTQVNATTFKYLKLE